MLKRTDRNVNEKKERRKEEMKENGIKGMI